MNEVRVFDYARRVDEQRFVVFFADRFDRFYVAQANRLSAAAVAGHRQQHQRYAGTVQAEEVIELVEQPTDVTGWNPGGYLETTEIPEDAWGQEFYYEMYPETGKAFVIISFGADGEEGGEGEYDADLHSTDAQ